MRVCERDVLILHCRQWGFDLAPPWQRLIPATLQLPGHSAIGGINPVVLPPGVVNIILGVFQGQCSRLAFRVLFRRPPIQGVSGGLDARRLQSLQDRGCNRLVHTEAPEAQTG